MLSTGAIVLLPNGVIKNSITGVKTDGFWVRSPSAGPGAEPQLEFGGEAQKLKNNVYSATENHQSCIKYSTNKYQYQYQYQ